MSVCAEPVEPAFCALIPASLNPLGVRLFAPSKVSPADLVVQWPTCAIPGYPLIFDVVPREDLLPDDPLARAHFSTFVASHLHATASSSSLGASPRVSVAEAAPLLGSPGARVAFRPPPLSHNALSIDALSLAGIPITCGALPHAVQVGANHDAAPLGSVHAAAEAGDVVGVLRALCSGGSTEEAAMEDEDWQGPLPVSTPIIAAAGRGHLGVVKLLAAAGADVAVMSARERNPLIAAAEHGHADTVKFLLSDPRCDPNAMGDGHETNTGWKYGPTALYVAISENHAAVVRDLLEDPRTCPNATCEEGGIPLLRAMGRACRQSPPNFDILDMLLAHPLIDVNGPDMYNDIGTPLHYAVFWGQIHLVRRLLAHRNVDVNARNEKGDTPLLLAAMALHREPSADRPAVVRALLSDSRVDASVVTSDGRTVDDLLQGAQGEYDARY